MSRVLFAPRKYIQGAGVMSEIGDYAVSFGKTALLIADEMVVKTCGETIQDSLSKVNVACHHELFRGECTEGEINRILEIGRKKSIDMVIAAGGGKTIDTGKAVSMK